jgi:hypothetical protein
MGRWRSCHSVFFFERSPDVVLIRRSVTRVRRKPCEAEAEYFEGLTNT